MIELTAEMKQAIDNALGDGHPVISASVGDDGQPILAFFGTAQAYSDDQLALWVRNPEGGFLRRIAANPQISLLYRNPAERVMWQFHGRAQVVDDEAVRKTVYERAPEVERNMDQERRGKAVVVDLDRVIHRGQVIMARDEEQQGRAED
jgi:uncharacterized pyridoxamine 5'-phosphate oxidase family protein